MEQSLGYLLEILSAHVDVDEMGKRIYSKIRNHDYYKKKKDEYKGHDDKKEFDYGWDKDKYDYDNHKEKKKHDFECYCRPKKYDDYKDKDVCEYNKKKHNEYFEKEKHKEKEDHKEKFDCHEFDFKDFKFKKKHGGYY